MEVIVGINALFFLALAVVIIVFVCTVSVCVILIVGVVFDFWNVVVVITIPFSIFILRLILDTIVPFLVNLFCIIISFFFLIRF